MAKKKAIIAGAGLSGLTLGIALAQRDWDVQIFERSSELREIGAGLYLWENGLKVLESIDVFDEVSQNVELIQSLNMIDETQDLLNSTKFTEGNRFCVIPRKEIHSALARKAQKLGVRIETNVRVASAESSGTITLANGIIVKANLIVGADGINSSIRNSTNIECTVEKVNNGALRALIPRIDTDETGVAMEHWNGIRRIGIAPSTDQYRYVYLTSPSTDTDGLSDPMNKDAWLSSFPHLESVIERIDYSRLDQHFYYIYMKTWSAGKVAILGDAAHGMEPNLGQGAGVSITSALELAKQLENSEVETALKNWEDIMKPVADMTQAWSRIYGAAASNWPTELMHIRSETVKMVMASENVDYMLSTAARHMTGSTILPVVGSK